jgi:modulator of FtsH protease
VSPSGASEWTDLFVAAAGASAALTGLVFVAVSINIQEILRLPGVPDRALATLMLLLGAVVISLLPLIPDQSGTALGLELVLVGLAFIAVICVTGARSFRLSYNRAVRVELVVLAGLGTVPYLVGGAMLLAGGDGGLYWVIAGVIGAIVGAVLNAWVLLVEILR